MKKIICLFLALMLLVCFAGCGNQTTDNVKDEIEKVEDIIDNIGDNTENSEGMLVNFENFYFEVKGAKMKNFATYGDYLKMKPEEVYTDVATSEECVFTVQDGEKANKFSLSFYYDGTKTEDNVTIVSEVYVYNDAENPLDISFAQGVKFGDTVDEVMKKYGKPCDVDKDDDGNIYCIAYYPENDWIEIEFEFNDNDELSGFRVRYDYDDYLRLNK